MDDTHPAGGELNRIDTERAEELVDRMGQTLGDLASRLSLQILRGVARAREEAEDMWAEAQAIHHGDQP